MRWEKVWVGFHVIQNKHEHCQDRDLARAGGADCKDVDTIQQLYHGLDLMALRRVGPEIPENFTYKLLPCF